LSKHLRQRFTQSGKEGLKDYLLLLVPAQLVDLVVGQLVRESGAFLEEDGLGVGGEVGE
jgi:hypothetical protein